MSRMVTGLLSHVGKGNSLFVRPLSTLNSPLNRSAEAAKFFVQNVLESSRNGRKFDGDVYSLLSNAMKVNNRDLVSV